MPTEVADLLVTGRGGQDAARFPPWSRLPGCAGLSDGWTVSRLASDTGYSERAMYRLLRAFYQRIGVSTRLEAIMLAHDKGWLRTSRSGPVACMPAV